MNRIEIESCFSKERLYAFFQKYPDSDSKGIYLYIANKQLSEAFYTSLSVLEISLRNSIHQSLSKKYKRKDWYEEFRKNSELSTLYPKIEYAKKKIRRKKRRPTSGRMVAELSFGFWTSLFNDEYEMQLWKPLRLAFPNLPKEIRQRERVKVPLNKIRQELRNRVYHYEPIILRINELEGHHSNIKKLLYWMNPGINGWLENIDRFPAIFSSITKNLNTF